MISIWKQYENSYFAEKYLYGINNPEFFAGTLLLANVTKNNKNFYRLQLRIAKNKKRKIRQFTQLRNRKGW